MTENNAQHASQEPEVVVRRARPGDQDAVTCLYEMAPASERFHDNGEDVRDITGAYLSDGDDGSSFWVAEADGDGVIGMVGVRREGASMAKMRRLRVHPDWRQRGIGKRLVREALGFCRDRGYVKVALQAEVEQEAAIALFKRFGFQLTRTRMVDDIEVMEFYMDLYRDPDDSDD